MSELRLDPTTAEWVIVAAGRWSRPEDFAPQERRPRPPGGPEGCPFCPGNEAMTPPTVLALPAGDGPHAPDRPSGWRVRAFENLFAAVTEHPPGATSTAPLFEMRPGAGAHEVIVETPSHNSALPDRSDSEVRLLLEAYRARFRALATQPAREHVVIFRNSGEGSGASLQHPHSQVIALSLVPPAVGRRLDTAAVHHRRTGRCLYCDIIAAERSSLSRLVFERDGLMAVCPFGSTYAGEVWIMPREHLASFGTASDSALDKLAPVLKETLHRIRAGFGDPATNLVVQSALNDGVPDSTYHWHVQIIPRLVQTGGFEIGTGVYINTLPPEDAAIILRRAIQT